MTSEATSAADGLARLWRRAAARPRVTLLLLCLALWTPGVFALPPIDRDESRFAQSSKQMLETGDFVDIRFGAEPRYKKPVGIYWLQAATTAAAGFGQRNHIWTYRLPSLLGGMAAVLLTFWCASAFASAEAALLAAALLAASLLLSVEATMATTDAVLLACVLGVQGVLARVYLAARDETRQRPRSWLVMAGWAAFAAGVLVKGPVILAVGGLTAIALAAWDRRWRWLGMLRPVAGSALAVAIAAPWLVAIALASHGAFYQQSLGEDFAAKLAGGQESHGAPPGAYLVAATLTFWPAILFLAPAIAQAVARRSEPVMRFLLVWAWAPWVLFELAPTKLPHYVLPMYPALAMMAALWLVEPAGPAGGRWRRLFANTAAVQFVAAAGLLVAAPIVAPALYGAGAAWPLVALAVSGGLVSLAALIALRRGRKLAAAALAVGSALMLYPTLMAGAAPLLQSFWISPRAASLVAAHLRPGDPPTALAGYEEPSLVFLLGTDTLQSDGPGAADAGAAHGGLALIEDSERDGFTARLVQDRAGADLVGQLDGFNYSNGKPAHLGLYRMTSARPAQKIAAASPLPETPPLLNSESR